MKSTRDDVAVGLIGTHFNSLHGFNGIGVLDHFICFVYPSFCVGHEHPFSILLLHISQQLHGGGESSVQNAPVQFLVRRKVTAGDGATGK